MANAKVDFPRLTGILFAVCFLASLILAVVNSQTRPMIEATNIRKAASARKGVLPAETIKVDGATDAFLVDLSKDWEGHSEELAGVLSDAQEKAHLLKVFRGYDKAGKVTGYAFTAELPDGYSGMLQYMLGVTWDQAKSEFVVAGASILKHGETPGLGANIVAASYQEKVAAKKEHRPPVPKFLKQFLGKAVGKIRLKKEDPPGDLDALTAATITSKAYTQSVRKALGMCNRNVSLFRNPKPSAQAAGQTQEGA
jgi:electron transport complex protein RnfG